ncbi:transposase [Sedimentisphaera salicampi]|uniref:Transposase n=1 Tax=Sedimentisphaera salicampi TaxID=1941349 RepID=A0A1W6LNX4_9BACT|nr:transposase [Sedimentisphaera salicampi]ARN57436.1 Transposase [Sedimentisphaera salicampi]
MAIIQNKYLFSWENLENSKDLERLEFVLSHLPDEKLMRSLEKVRGRGRNDYPIRAVWNSLLAGFVFEHNSIASLRRELSRNPLLRQLCGFNPALGQSAVPSDDAYTNFFKLLSKHENKLSNIFENLVSKLSEKLPNFGKDVAIDGKTIPSLAIKETDKSSDDGRRDTDADWSVKSYTNKEGKVTKKVSVFGYTLHLLVDAKYELPIQRKVTPGNESEVKQVEEIVGSCNPKVKDKIEHLIADKGYDSGDLNKKLLRKDGIKAVIDSREMGKADYWPVDDSFTVFYDQKGRVYCRQKGNLKLKNMPFAGFEKNRETLKYRCPVKHYGIGCPNAENCSIASSIRIPLALNPRIFTAVARGSLKWERLYKKRSSVERTFSRLDVSFGFENHYIRGLEKMRTRVDMALITMLGIAYGSVMENKHKKMRSLVNCRA